MDDLMLFTNDEDFKREVRERVNFSNMYWN